jgi:ABC-type amino acid transport substrate-binding protein
VLHSGCRWRNCPAEYGPATTIYNRWSAQGVWRRPARRKGEDKLMTAVNEWVHVNLRNGKLNEIYKRYNGTELPLEMLV